MGWSSYRATHYTKSGAVDRKAECDAVFVDGLNRGHYRVEKSVMVGVVYYAAIRKLKQGILDKSGKHMKDADGKYLYEDIPEKEQKVGAVVLLTSTENNHGFNFSYKDMDETMGPNYYDCPASILKLLTPTENETAKIWRERCVLHAQAQRIIKNCPVGTILEYTNSHGEAISIRKRAASYQFKGPWWYCEKHGGYVKSSHIPDSFLLNGKEWSIENKESNNVTLEEEPEQLTLDLDGHDEY